MLDAFLTGNFSFYCNLSRGIISCLLLSAFLSSLFIAKQWLILDCAPSVRKRSHGNAVTEVYANVRLSLKMDLLKEEVKMMQRYEAQIRCN